MRRRGQGRFCKVAPVPWCLKTRRGEGLADRAVGQIVAMTTSPLPTDLWLGILAGWLNRQRQAVIEYLRTENEVLKRQLNGRRPRLTDDERRRLAVRRPHRVTMRLSTTRTSRAAW